MEARAEGTCIRDEVWSKNASSLWSCFWEILNFRLLEVLLVKQIFGVHVCLPAVSAVPLLSWVLSGSAQPAAKGNETTTCNEKKPSWFSSGPVPSHVILSIEPCSTLPASFLVLPWLWPYPFLSEFSAQDPRTSLWTPGIWKTVPSTWQDTIHSFWC